MAQQVDFINTALGLLGNEPVVDLTPASLAQSTAATKLMRSIEAARLEVLTRHGWLCALEYVTLPSSPPPTANWRYPSFFLAPGDAVRIWEIAGDILDGRELGPGPRWELGTSETGDASRIVIRVNPAAGLVAADGTLNIAYVRLANWASFDQHLVDAIAADCAKRQAMSITGDKQMVDKLAQAAEGYVQKAIGKDATQTGGQPPAAGSVPAQLRAYARGAGGPDGWANWNNWQG